MRRHRFTDHPVERKHFSSRTEKESYVGKNLKHKKASNFTLAAGLLLSFLCGIIGIIIAYTIVFGKHPSGSYVYDDESRMLGKGMLVVACVMFFMLFSFCARMCYIWRDGF